MPIPKRSVAGIISALIAVSVAAFYVHARWSRSEYSARDELLAQMPADATAVFYLDLDGLRQSPFLRELYKWAPQTKVDADYAQFLESTGFNYETDLDRLAVAVLKNGQDSTVFAMADGKFDRKKISAYASQNGTQESRGGREIFRVPQGSSTRRIAFTFLSNDRIAITSGARLEPVPSEPPADSSDTLAWRERFRRLLGSPVFVVVRQAAAAGTALSERAPSGWQSPQLSALLDQLQWITVAGKPDADRLRLVLEGEGAASSAPTRQLSSVLNGLLVLAQAGLNDQKMRQSLQPDVREAYLEMLKSADVSEIDRGETKSVRLVFDLTPKFLDAARAAIPLTPAEPPSKVRPNKGTIRN